MARAPIFRREPLTSEIGRVYKAGLKIGIQKIDYSVEGGRAPWATATVLFSGTCDELLEFVKILSKGDENLIKHLAHIDMIQCPVCIADAMGEKPREEVGTGDSSATYASANTSASAGPSIGVQASQISVMPNTIP